MRIFLIIGSKWFWRGILFIWAAAEFFGYSLDWRSTLDFMTTLEIDIINRGGDPIIFGFAVGLIFATWIVPDIWRVIRRRIALPERLNPPNWQVLRDALFWIVDQSAWMRWFEAQRASARSRELNMLQKLHLASNELKEKARNGEVEIRGRLAQQFGYMTISTDFWRSVFIDLERDDHTLWRVKLRPGTERGLPTVPEIPDYATLEVNEKKIKELWPAEDKKLDRLTQKLLK